MSAPNMQKAAEALKTISQNAEAQEKARMRDHALLNARTSAAAFRAAGMAEGDAKAKSQLIRAIAAKGKGADEIAALVDLPIEDIRRILTQS